MSPAVYNLVQSLGINVTKLSDDPRYAHTYGFYRLLDNCIYINEKLCNTVDMIDNTVLHEIVHWTGGGSQLKRQTLACYGSYQRYEEHLAQRTAYELAVKLDVVTPRIERFTEDYLKEYPIKGFEKHLITEDIELIMFYIDNVSKRRDVA